MRNLESIYYNCSILSWGELLHVFQNFYLRITKLSFHTLSFDIFKYHLLSKLYFLHLVDCLLEEDILGTHVLPLTDAIHDIEIFPV